MEIFLDKQVKDFEARDERNQNRVVITVGPIDTRM
jgi:hypothetical protein